MSKLTKLITKPKLFFQDMNKPKVSKKKPTAKKKSIVTKTIKEEIHTISTLWNKILVTRVDLSHYEICLYFSGDVKDIYQVEQWIPILEQLNTKKKLIILARNQTSFDWLNKNTSFTIIHCKTIQDVLKFYEENNIKIILYVNHAFKNFQSLINNRAYHIHINHGESDKTSTITRQSQAYDYVFVYGNESINKYLNNLIVCDKSKFIKIGRPQLEHTEFKNIESNGKQTVLYAPTWEGTHDTMDFTSIRTMGVDIIRQLINDGKYHIIYKPHPKVGTRDSYIQSLHKEILNLLNNYEDKTIMLDGNIVSIYKSIDIAIFDNSVVLLDFLPFDKPLLVTDVADEKRKQLMNNKSLILEAGKNISKENISSIVNIIQDELENDTFKEQRNHVKEEFLGNFDYSNFESTNKFINELTQLCIQRDKALQQLNSNETL